MRLIQYAHGKAQANRWGVPQDGARAKGHDSSSR
jgi:hypothetical protein